MGIRSSKEPSTGDGNKNASRNDKSNERRPLVHPDISKDLNAFMECPAFINSPNKTSSKDAKRSSSTNKSMRIVHDFGHTYATTTAAFYNRKFYIVLRFSNASNSVEEKGFGIQGIGLLAFDQNINWETQDVTACPFPAFSFTGVNVGRFPNVKYKDTARILFMKLLTSITSFLLFVLCHFGILSAISLVSAAGTTNASPQLQTFNTGDNSSVKYLQGLKDFFNPIKYKFESSDVRMRGVWSLKMVKTSLMTRGPIDDSPRQMVEVYQLQVDGDKFMEFQPLVQVSDSQATQNIDKLCFNQKSKFMSPLDTSEDGAGMYRQYIYEEACRKRKGEVIKDTSV